MRPVPAARPRRRRSRPRRRPRPRDRPPPTRPRTHAVRAGHARRPVGDQQDHRASRRRGADGAQHGGLGIRVETRRRLVEEQDAAPARTSARAIPTRRRWPLDSPAPRSPSTSARVHRRPARPPPAPRATSASDAPGVRRGRTLSATVPGEQERGLRAPRRRRRRQASRVERPDVDRASRPRRPPHPPRRRLEQAQDHGQQRALAGPARPVTATTSPGAHLERDLGRGRHVPAGLHDARRRRRPGAAIPAGGSRSTPPRRARRVDDLEGACRRGQALLAGVELRAEPPEREVGLRARGRARTGRPRASARPPPAAARSPPRRAPPRASPAAPGPSPTGTRPGAWPSCSMR